MNQMVEEKPNLKKSDSAVIAESAVLSWYRDCGILMEFITDNVENLYFVFAGNMQILAIFAAKNWIIAA